MKDISKQTSHPLMDKNDKPTARPTATESLRNEDEEDDLFDFRPYRKALNNERKRIAAHPPLDKQKVTQLMKTPRQKPITRPLALSKSRHLLHWPVAAAIAIAISLGAYTLYYIGSRPTLPLPQPPMAKAIPMPLATPMQIPPPPAQSAKRPAAEEHIASLPPAPASLPPTSTPDSFMASSAQTARQPLVLPCHDMIAYLDDTATADALPASLIVIETQCLVAYQEVNEKDVWVSSWDILGQQCRMFFRRNKFALLAFNNGDRHPTPTPSKLQP